MTSYDWVRNTEERYRICFACSARIRPGAKAVEITAPLDRGGTTLRGQYFDQFHCMRGAIQAIPEDDRESFDRWLEHHSLSIRTWLT